MKLNEMLLKTTFNTLDGERSSLLEAWENYANWTLVHVFPELNTADMAGTIQHDYQSVGAQATNHLANKIATVLFRPGKPFFRLDLDESQVAELISAGMEDSEIQPLLSKAEKAGMKELTKVKLRTAALAAIKSLIITGNSLMYMPDKSLSTKVKAAQVYSLRDYVVQRDMSGEVYRIITKDSHLVATLPADIQELVLRDANGRFEPNDTIEIYTGIERQHSGKYLVWQELDNITRVPRRIGSYAADDLPWIPLTWNLTRGSNYGSGLVEEYSGDFFALSALSQTLVQLTAIMADIKLLVNPLGQTDVQALNQAASGSAVAGIPDDIVYLHLEKTADLKFLMEQMEALARRIGAGFLFNSAVTRNAERVTAEEIRMQANELEGSLGGVYSRLSEDMQEPIARRAMLRVDKKFKGVTPIITTGIESLSRTSELDQILLFFNDLAVLAQLPEPVLERMDYPAVVALFGANRQVDHEKLLLDEKTVTENREKAGALEAKTAQDSKQPPEQV